MAPQATQPFDAPARSGTSVSLPVAAATVLFTGAIAALNAAGNVVPADDAANLRVAGRIIQDINNAAGAAGDQQVVIDRGVFAWKNSAAEPVTAAHVGQPGFVEDDTTIASDPGDHGVVAGLIVAVEGQRVWVDTREAPALQRVLAAEAAIAAIGD